VALCPVWARVSLEENCRFSPELDVSDSLVQSVRMEILSINVPENLWLLPKLILVLVFYSES
jgi:hypothetical protein